MDFIKMGTRSFVDVYEQMIRNHNNRIEDNVMDKRIDNTNNPEQILKQADENEDDSEEDLNLSDDEEDQNVEDEKEELDDEEGDQEEDFNLDDGDEQLDEEPQSQTNPEELNTQNEVAFNFPDALLTEFINTVNQYTRLCADIVQNKSVTKTKQQSLDKLVGKMKNLIQAAQKTEQ